MALLLSLWLSCGGGGFRTFEDVLLSVRSITTDMGVEARVSSIDNVLSHFAAVVKRRVSGTFQVYSRLLPRCVHVHDWHALWAGVIKCGFAGVIAATCVLCREVDRSDESVHGVISSVSV